jgi:hypothetical protein
VPTLGFIAADFRIFEVGGCDQRMQLVLQHIGPKLGRLADDLAPALSRRFDAQFSSHMGRFARRSTTPPPEMRVAFAACARGYRRHPHLALCISRAGIHSRVIVESAADGRTQIARRVRERAGDLARALRGTRLERYDGWRGLNLPAGATPTRELFETLATRLAERDGRVDIGFGWPVREALRLDRMEVLDAFAALEPVYRALRAPL